MIPALGFLFAGVGAAMVGAMTYETTTGHELVGSPTNQQAQAAEERSPSQEELRSFALAHREVVDLQQRYNERIAAVPNPEVQERLRAEALDRMRTTIADHGLTVPQYNQLYETARDDPVVRERVIEELAEVPGGQ